MVTLLMIISLGATRNYILIRFSLTSHNISEPYILMNLPKTTHKLTATINRTSYNNKTLILKEKISATQTGFNDMCTNHDDLSRNTFYVLLRLHS